MPIRKQTKGKKKQVKVHKNEHNLIVKYWNGWNWLACDEPFPYFPFCFIYLFAPGSPFHTQRRGQTSLIIFLFFFYQPFKFPQPEKFHHKIYAICFLMDELERSKVVLFS